MDVVLLKFLLIDEEALIKLEIFIKCKKSFERKEKITSHQGNIYTQRSNFK